MFRNVRNAFFVARGRGTHACQRHERERAARIHILVGTNQTKDLRILKSGDLKQKPRKDLGNKSTCPLEQLYSVRTVSHAGVGIGADKLALGF